MNTLDIIILIAIVIPALLGLKNGLLRSIFSLTGIVLGLFLATRYNDKIISLFSFLNLDAKLSSLISFIAIIIVCYFISVYLARKISGINIVTTTFDKILGTIFGIFKGLIIVSLFLIFSANTFNFFDKETIAKSKFYSSVVNIAPDVYDYLKTFFPNAKDFYEELNQTFFRV